MAWLYIPGAEVDDPVMQAEDIGFDYIDPNPMGSKLTEFFQTVEKKNWLDLPIRYAPNSPRDLKLLKFLMK